MICRWCSPWHLDITCHELYNLKSLYIAIFRRLRHFEMSPILHHMWITNFTPPKYRKPHHLHIINSIVWISLYAMISDDGVRDRWYSDVTNYIICISSTQSSEYRYMQWFQMMEFVTGDIQMSRTTSSAYHQLNRLNITIYNDFRVWSSWQVISRCRLVPRHCNAMQSTATHCNALQRTTMHCNTLQRTATWCNTVRCVVVF